MKLYGRILPIEAITRDRDLLTSLISSLPFGKSEQDRLSHIRNEFAQRESLAAWLALWDLAQLLSLPLPARVLRTPEGKPYFEDPTLPAFSLSHTDSFALAVISTEGSIGVDIEGIGRSVSFGRIAERYFSKEEQASLERSNTPQELFLKIWTKKEALAKMTGEGLASIAGKKNDPECSVYSFQIKRANDFAHLSIATQKPAESIQWLNLQKEISISR